MTDSFRGTLVWCGSTAWNWIGRRTAKGAPKGDEMTDFEFASPHVYGPTSDLDIQKAITHCSSSHVVVIDADGIAYTFGRNDKGQLGDGTTEHNDEPFQVELDEKVIGAATGRGHTLLVTESGKVYASGDNKCFQALGRNEKDPLEFSLVEGLKDVKIKSVACGAEFSIALDENGCMHSWGNPQYGQLGF